MFTRIAITLVCITQLSLVIADPPKVDYLSPAGMTAGTSRTIKATGKFDVWPPKVWVDRDGIEVKPLEEKNSFEITATPEAVGTFHCRFYDAAGSSVLRPFIVDSLPSVDEVEPNNDLANAQSIESSSIIDGVLHKGGEVDVFQLKLSAGQTLVASVAANWQLGSPMDPVLQILDAKGFVLLQNDDNVGFDPRAAFEVPEDGTYFVRVFAFPATPNSTIAFSGAATYVYRLTLTTDGFLDACLPLAAPAGKARDAQGIGWNMQDTKITLPQLEGDEVGVVCSVGGNAGSVPLPVTDIPVAVAAQDSETELAIPSLVSGQIAAKSDRHRFRFAGKKGDAIRIAIESDSLGYLLDPVLRLSDAEGNQIIEIDDASGQRDCVLQQTLKADGDYVLELRDLYGHGGPRYVYRMLVEHSSPKYALSVATDSFQVKAGQTLNVPVTITRERSCTDQIEFSVVGLPDDAKLKAAKSEAKGATAKAVTLEITAGQAAFSGPIEIVGTGASTQQATFSIAGTTHKHRSVWLTIEE